MATTVKITETYDLKTTTGKLGLIGIHTPTSSMVSRLYPGLCKNHKFIRVQKCDVTGVCASVLPADPLQIGVQSGDVAPEDMFNPILYKPVSNESFETVLGRIYNSGIDISTLGSLAVTDEPPTTDVDPFQIYYALLSESKHWKKAMPQSGFGLRGLFPICYQMINQYGNVGEIGVGARAGQSQVNATADRNVATTDSGIESITTRAIAMSFRGKSVKMPRIPLHKTLEYGKYGMGDYSEDASWDATEVGDFDIPRTFVAMFVIPPARLHEFYYRMRVTWTLTFEGVCSVLDVGNLQAYNSVAGTTYAKNFNYASSKATLENPTDLVDTTGVSINKIMES